MPATLTYPGVYVEEIPSGVRTIVGVATSITAFVGRTPYGPVDVATTINSYGDFDAQFGGLADAYPLTYAVRTFSPTAARRRLFCDFSPLAREAAMGWRRLQPGR